MPPSDLIAMAGVLSGLAVFFVGLNQYRNSQAWKRSEFVATEIKDAFKDKAVRTALQMMDWNSTYCDLSNNDCEAELKKTLVTDEILSRALTPHMFRPDCFNPVETRIRVIFDELLGSLQRFEHFIEAGLVEKKNFDPYLRYWMKIMGDSTSGRKPITVLHSIWRYIEFYGYDDVQRLFGRFGYDIKQFDRNSHTPTNSLIGCPIVTNSVNGTVILDVPQTAAALMREAFVPPETLSPVASITADESSSKTSLFVPPADPC